MLTDRFTETTRNRAELRLVLYSGNLLSELQQNAIVPQLLSRDPALISALASGDFSQSSQRLISFNENLGRSLTLLDKDGRVVAATDRETHGAPTATRLSSSAHCGRRDNVFNILRANRALPLLLLAPRGNPATGVPA